MDKSNLHMQMLNDISSFHDLPHLRIVALVGNARAGTKFLQSYLDDHKEILMIPGYPLLYLYPNFDKWCEQYSSDFSWERVIDLFCEKHASVLDSRRIKGLSGLERLGPEKGCHIEIDESMFRNFLRHILNGMPVKRKTFLLAVHYAYGFCKGWNLNSKKILFYHLHDPQFLPSFAKDFPEFKLIYMVRNPRRGTHAGVRALCVADKEKLNFTDYLRLAGRNFWQVYKYQFDVFDRFREYLKREQVVVLKLEDLQEVGDVMTHLANWLGISFSESMLKSTFDGKAWWGDYGRTKQMNTFDVDVLQEKETVLMGGIERFVIEGLSFHFFKKYEYNLTIYKKDNFFNRLKLILFILFPSRTEINMMKFYLNPHSHFNFIRGAFKEAFGYLQCRNYTSNASYFYKRTYKDLKLWQRRIHERFLDFANKHFTENPFSITGFCIILLSRGFYIVGQYVRFLVAVFVFPKLIFKRYYICYCSLWRRMTNRLFLPKLLD